MNSLLQQTLDMLEKTSIPLLKIASDTQVGYRWLCDLKSGRFADPGVNKIERLNKYLLSNREAA